MNPIRIRITERKRTHSRVYREGEIFQANIRRDGYAVVVGLGVVFKPDSYEIYLTDLDYAKLLN